MPILKVVTWPAKVLETKAEEVTEFNDELRAFVADMHSTMDRARGIGLAANQVADLRRILTIHIPFADNRYEKEDHEEKGDDAHDRIKEWWHNKRFTFINPVIVEKKGKTSYQEGCLSFPEMYDFVDRASEIWVKALDEYGKPFEIHATGLLAICLQHEIDHIDGIVFITRMSRFKAQRIRKKMMTYQFNLETKEPAYE